MLEKQKNNLFVVAQEGNDLKVLNTPESKQISV